MTCIPFSFRRTRVQVNAVVQAYRSAYITKLVRNYRSHPEILRLPNALFYDGELQAHGDHIVTHSLLHWEKLPNHA